ncbi:MAG: DUF4384 domain-containing protein [Nitrospirae bacterium]|nr:MAG: DUF4384 domain-containing protein [Nitrospirota bacterium]
MKSVPFIIVAIILYAGMSYAQIVKSIQAEGACAIVGMSAEQCQLTALQRARASAIEQAAGMSVASSTLVTNMALTAEFIKSYSKGFIVKEKVEWLPVGQYRENPSTPPIVEYRVKIIADIKVPEPKINPIGLTAKTNAVLYKAGDKAVIEISALREAKAAIFNITADDRVIMLFPNEHDKDNLISENGRLIYPVKDSKAAIEMHTLPGHKRDAEAFFIAAMDSGHKRKFTDLFKPSQPMSFGAFFKKYSEIADYCEDVILTYEVVGEE